MFTINSNTIDPYSWLRPCWWLIQLQCYWNNNSFFLYCANFNTPLFDKIATIDVNILTENEDSIINTLSFGKPNTRFFLQETFL